MSESPVRPERRIAQRYIVSLAGCGYVLSVGVVFAHDHHVPPAMPELFLRARTSR